MAMVILSPEELYKTSNAFMYVYIMSLENIPVGYDVIMQAQKDHPEYFINP